MTKMRFLIAVAVLTVTAGACDDDEPTAPDTGTIEVTVTTTGDGTDECGYTVRLDEGTEEEDVACADGG